MVIKVMVMIPYLTPRQAQLRLKTMTSKKKPTPAASKWLQVELTPKLYEELTLVAQQVGFGDLEALVQNYLRDVAIAARTELATLETRQSVLKDAGDLDSLKPKSTVPKKP